MNVSLDLLCGLDIKPQTCADFARCIVALDDPFYHAGCVEFQKTIDDTCAIVLNGWIVINNSEGRVYTTDSEPNPKHGQIEIEYRKSL